jgi:hypothetical protein
MGRVLVAERFRSSETTLAHAYDVGPSGSTVVSAGTMQDASSLYTTVVNVAMIRCLLYRLLLSRNLPGAIPSYCT